MLWLSNVCLHNYWHFLMVSIAFLEQFTEYLAVFFVIIYDFVSIIVMKLFCGIIGDRL